jgi:predicted Holliday junction resolvase-like endonuclease
MDTLREWWALIFAGLSGLVWLVRLEARATSNTREIERMWRQRKEDLEASKASRDETNAKLDKLDEKMDKAFGELRADIKSIIRHGG